MAEKRIITDLYTYEKYKTTNSKYIIQNDEEG